MKTNNLETVLILERTRNKILKNGIEHIDQCLGNIPNPIKKDDLEIICDNINQIKRICCLVAATINDINDYELGEGL